MCHAPARLGTMFSFSWKIKVQHSPRACSRRTHREGLLKWNMCFEQTEHTHLTYTVFTTKDNRTGKDQKTCIFCQTNFYKDISRKKDDKMDVRFSPLKAALSCWLVLEMFLILIHCENLCCDINRRILRAGHYKLFPETSKMISELKKTVSENTTLVSHFAAEFSY